MNFLKTLFKIQPYNNIKMVVSDFTEYWMSKWCHQRILWKRFSKMNVLNEYCLLQNEYHNITYLMIICGFPVCHLNKSSQSSKSSHQMPFELCYRSISIFNGNRYGLVFLCQWVWGFIFKRNSYSNHVRDWSQFY